MTIKILFVIANEQYGGGERSFEQIINRLDPARYSVFVACFPQGAFVDHIRSKATVIPVDLRSQLNLLNILSLSRIMRKCKIAIVHSQGIRADFYARLAAVLARVPFRVSTVAVPPEKFDVGGAKKFLYYLLDTVTQRLTDLFIVVSDEIRTILTVRHGIPLNKIVKIHNGITTSEWRAPRRPPEMIRNELSVPAGCVLIGTVGRLVWAKGLPVFLEAARRLLDQRPSTDVRFLVVGEGPERASLESLSQRLGIRDKIIFAGFRTDVRDLLPALDIFVLASLSEGQPIIALEAMASGVPIVATRLAGVLETLRDGETGLLVDPGDPAALSRAMAALLGDREKASLLAVRARDHAAAHFDYDAIFPRYEAAYQALVTSTPVARN